MRLFFATQVIATDVQETTFTSTATATIKIIDANDMIPQFNENTYRLNVAENSPNGTEIQVITVGALLVDAKIGKKCEKLFSVYL